MEKSGSNSSHFKKIRRMILFRVLMTPFIILLMVCGTIVYYFASYSGEQVKNKLSRVASDHRNLIDQFLGEREGNLQFIASSYRPEELCNNETLSKIFNNLQASSRAFFDLGVFDDKGNHLAYAGPYKLAGKNYANAEWFKAVQEKGVYISDEFMGYRNIPHFVIAVRRDENNQTWYLRATIDTFSFNDLVESIRIGKTGEAYIVNRSGILQTRRRSGGTLMEADPDFNTYKIKEDAITSFAARGDVKQRYLYAAIPLKKKDWIMVVRQEQSDAYSHLAISAIIAIFMMTGGGAVVSITGYLLASSMANRLSLADMEKRQMKSQLMMAGKLAEIGEMSTGLAHEINNPLQIMNSELTMIRDVLDDIGKILETQDPENLALLKDSVDQIHLQIQRCGRITEGLLRFARKTESAIQPVEIRNFLPDIIRMVEQRAQVENVKIVEKLDPGLPRIMSDPNQLQQVFLNLLNNAIYALKDKDNGEIQITASAEKSTVVISIADNGCGFSPENLERAFLPFFTTKPVGEGTGLGLSTVYGIVQRLGGEVNLTSEQNVGSIFTIRLPMKGPGDEAKNF